MRPDPWQRLKSKRYQAKNRAKLAAKSKHHERRDENHGQRPISNAENITEDSVYLSENDDFDDEEAYDISRVDQVTLDTIIAEVSSLSTCADYKIDIVSSIGKLMI